MKGKHETFRQAAKLARKTRQTCERKPTGYYRRLREYKMCMCNHALLIIRLYKYESKQNFIATSFG